MIALVGDAEIDEGNIFEALFEGWKQGLRNCWWIIDYNRQSLDAVMREGLYARFVEIFRSLRLGGGRSEIRRLLEAAFARARRRGASRLDRLPARTRSIPALVFQGGAAWRKRLTEISATDAASRSCFADAPTKRWRG